MDSILITNKKAKRVIKEIFEHPEHIYSIYFKDERDVIWVNSEKELYDYINNLEG